MKDSFNFKIHELELNIIKLEEIILGLQIENKRLQTIIHNNIQASDRQKKLSSYYEMLMAEIKKDEMLQEAWKSFIATVKLTVKNDIPGLTSSDKSREIEEGDLVVCENGCELAIAILPIRRGTTKYSERFFWFREHEKPVIGSQPTKCPRCESKWWKNSSIHIKDRGWVPPL